MPIEIIDNRASASASIAIQRIGERRRCALSYTGCRGPPRDLGFVKRLLDSPDRSRFAVPLLSCGGTRQKTPTGSGIGRRGGLFGRAISAISASPRMRRILTESDRARTRTRESGV